MTHWPIWIALFGDIDDDNYRQWIEWLLGLVG